MIWYSAIEIIEQLLLVTWQDSTLNPAPVYKEFKSSVGQ